MGSVVYPRSIRMFPNKTALTSLLAFVVIICRSSNTQYDETTNMSDRKETKGSAPSIGTPLRTQSIRNVHLLAVRERTVLATSWADFITFFFVQIDTNRSFGWETPIDKRCRNDCGKKVTSEQEM